MVTSAQGALAGLGAAYLADTAFVATMFTLYKTFENKQKGEAVAPEAKAYLAGEDPSIVLQEFIQEIRTVGVENNIAGIEAVTDSEIAQALVVLN